MGKVGPLQGMMHVLVQLHVGLHFVVLKDELNHLRVNQTGQPTSSWKASL